MAISSLAVVMLSVPRRTSATRRVSWSFMWLSAFIISPNSSGRLVSTCTPRLPEAMVSATRMASRSGWRIWRTSTTVPPHQQHDQQQHHALREAAVVGALLHEFGLQHVRALALQVDEALQRLHVLVAGRQEHVLHLRHAPAWSAAFFNSRALANEASTALRSSPIWANWALLSAFHLQLLYALLDVGNLRDAGRDDVLVQLVHRRVRTDHAGG